MTPRPPPGRSDFGSSRVDSSVEALFGLEREHLDRPFFQTPLQVRHHFDQKVLLQICFGIQQNAVEIEPFARPDGCPRDDRPRSTRRLQFRLLGRVLPDFRTPILPRAQVLPAFVSELSLFVGALQIPNDSRLEVQR